jgi:hypothetical protein
MGQTLTAIAGEHGIERPESPLFQATARASTGVFGGALTQGRDTQSVGPKPVNIGALAGSMGGVSMNVADLGKPPVRSYSVYAGYGGWMHSQVLPIITVNMRSFTKEQEPSLKSDPPAFEESLGRMEELLKTIRLRPTVPVMPELNAAK